MSEETSTPAGGGDASGGSAKSRKPYDPEELVGKTLAGRYEVEKCIGKGGMGVVYLASQRALERKVVIKVLPRSFVDDEEAIGRFEREAVGMSRLQHPHVVSIYDFGHEDDHAYICMEYIDGETLSRRVKRDGPLDVQTFAPIAAQILHGIGEAHSMGLIHRDIKPSNIMLTERHGQENYVKILDFGLAKLVKGARNVTKEQSLVGSTAFLAPEQIMGNDIDQRVDVYALGVLFYYMLTAVKPFTADDDITVLYQHVHNEPPPLVDKLPEAHRVPSELVGLIERMLAKNPEERPLNAGSILEELTDILATTSLQIAWTTGEYAALSPTSSSIEDTSGRQQPPMGHGSPGTPTPGMQQPGSGTQPSQTSFITSEQLLQMQKEATRRTLLVVFVALLVVAAGLVAFFELRGDGAKENLPSAEPNAVQEEVASEGSERKEAKSEEAKEVKSKEGEEAKSEVATKEESQEEPEPRAEEVASETAKPSTTPKPPKTSTTAKPPKPAKTTKPATTAEPAKPSKPANPSKEDNEHLLLPIEEQAAEEPEEPTNDDVKLLPIE